jgi:hypothetical protein
MRTEVRLAIRDEGEFTVARVVAPTEALEQGTIIATARTSALTLRGAFDAFIAMCTGMVQALIEDIGGVVHHVELREPEAVQQGPLQ